MKMDILAISESWLKMDILAISESLLNSSTSNAEVEIIGYKLHRLDRLHKKGSGVCIYVRNNFKTNRLKDLSYISTSAFHQLWIQTQVNKKESIIVCVSYRPRIVR